MSIKLKDDADLTKLLDEVATQLNGTFNDVREKLAKADKEESMAKAFPPADDKSAPPAAEESSPSPSADPGSAPAEASDAPPAPDASASPDASAAPADPAQDMGGQLTPEALQAEYAKLPPDELQMHKIALDACLAQMGGGMAPPDASAPPAPEMAPAPALAPPAPALKSQTEDKSLVKSETDLAKAEVASLKEDVEILAKTIKAMIETPVRKAITSIAELPKAEAEETAPKSYGPTEIWAKIKEVAKRPDLKKSDKQLIMDLYDRRVTPEVAAKHLARLFAEE